MMPTIRTTDENNETIQKDNLLEEFFDLVGTNRTVRHCFKQLLLRPGMDILILNWERLQTASVRQWASIGFLEGDSIQSAVAWQLHHAHAHVSFRNP